MENKQITCATIGSISELVRMDVPPRIYIGGHFIGWIQWYVMDNIEKLPRKIWKMVLQYENGAWQKTWEKADPVTITSNRTTTLVPNDNFTPTPDNIIAVTRRVVRELIPEGMRRCRCRSPIPDIFQTSCDKCGKVSITIRRDLYEVERLLARQKFLDPSTIPG